jgi:hypothetical protein
MSEHNRQCGNEPDACQKPPQAHQTHNTMQVGDHVTIVSATCPQCGKYYSETVQTTMYDAWAADRLLIQRAFPEMDEDMRELLISGECGSCFDKLFAEVSA